MSNTKKTKKLEKTIATFLIVLAVTMPIVFTALQPEIKDNEIQQNSSLDFFSNLVKKIISFFNLVPSVSAQDPVFGCCELTKPGAYPPNSPCQFPITFEQCAQGFHEGKTCENTENCKKGCCIDTTEGTCSISTKLVCGTNYFDNNPTCNIPNCELGCCDLISSGSPSTRTRCEEVLHGTFNPGVSESECVGSAQLEEQGCCVLPTTCKRTNMSNCDEILNGRFFRDNSVETPTYCSSLSQCSMCKGEKTTSCTNFDNNVHYLDPCGNIEGIASGGNCQANGQVCVQNGNEAICGGNCTINGIKRQHGESWCIYDVDPTAYDVFDFTNDLGKIPIGVMGSRDFRAVCLFGKEIIEPCADYRSQVCVQTKDSTIGRWNQGSCVMNMWPECLTINDKDVCEANNQCVWDANAELMMDSGTFKETQNELQKMKNVYKRFSKETTNDITFTNVSCLPRYPPGFTFTQTIEGCENKDKTECKKDSNCIWDDYTSDPTQSKCHSALDLLGGPLTCGLASYFGRVATTTVNGCSGNCNPSYLDYAEAMAKKCSALGDCGATINIAGVKTYDGFVITKSEGDQNNPQFKDLTNRESTFYDNKYWSWDNLDFFPNLQETSLSESEGIIKESKASSPLSNNFFDVIKVLRDSKQEFYSDWKEKLEGLGTNYNNLWLALGSAATVGGLIYLFMPKGFLIGEGIAIVVAYIVFLWRLFSWFFGEWKVEYFTYQCLPATPPLGGDDCTKCNLDSERPCSEYRCKSLGSACELINPGSSEQICDKMEDDGIPPKIINATSLTEDYTIPDFKPGPPSGSFSIIGPSTNAPDCFKAWDNVLISFKTNKYSKCSYSSAPGIPFESMRLIPPSDYTKNHALNLKSPSELIGSGQHSLYIKCQDNFGHIFTTDYTINFCVEIGPDLAVVDIGGTNYDYYSKFPYGVTELPLQIYVNKPSQCRWDTSKEKTYSEMSETTQCTSEQSLSGNYNCETILTGLQPDIANNFYIRCNSSEGIMNDIPFELTLYSTSALLIDSVSPSDNEKISGCELQSQVTLKVETSEGSDEGQATCYWTYEKDYSKLNRFDTTDSTYHEENITIKSSGTKTVYISCFDLAGNQAYVSTKFSIIKDDQPPFITRLYRQGGGDLILVTNEPSKCLYKTTTCDFDVKRITTPKFQPTGSFETSHTTPWIDQNQWYVKCYDECDNIASCTTIYPEEI